MSNPINGPFKGVQNSDGTVTFNQGGLMVTFPWLKLSTIKPGRTITVTFQADSDVNELRKAWADQHGAPFTEDDQGNVIFDDPADEVLWTVTRP